MNAIDYSPCFREEIVPIIFEATRANFVGEHDPEGNAWAELSEATLAARAEPGHEGNVEGPDKKLVDTGYMLRQTLQNPVIETTPNTLTYGVRDVPYAAKHQKGGTSAAGNQVPQRKFLGWNRAMIEEAKVAIGRYAAASLRAALRAA